MDHAYFRDKVSAYHDRELPAQEQEMLDGSADVQTQAQKLAHIQSLITRVAPFTFVDLDGTSSEVKVTGASKNVSQYSPRQPGADQIGL